ncbi:MAG TPA: tetratricopeptide repeat protein, partial [Steroidobacteraceae bacterium]|nr:tetratricopeptide repeat protein [Steroidobacteraceae bacterium]
MSAPAEVRSIAVEATRAFVQQRYAEAAASYERCIALMPREPAFHFNLGTAREKQGDIARAVEAYLAAWRLNPKDARLALFAGAALESAGRRQDAAVLFSLGDDIDLAVRRAKDRPDIDPEIRRRSATADRVMREHLTGLHAAAVTAFEREATAANGEPPDVARVRNAVWVQTHDRPFTYLTPNQKPALFYMPDLPAVPVVPRERLPWAGALEARTAELRDEYLAAVAAGAEHSPYVDAATRGPIWQQLRGKLDWSSLHLYKVGMESPFVRLFPKTLAALETADVVHLEG